MNALKVRKLVHYLSWFALVLWLANVAIILYRFESGGLPIRTGDDEIFLIVLWTAAVEGLPRHPWLPELDPDIMGRYVWHGFLNQWLVRALPRPTDVHQVLTWSIQFATVLAIAIFACLRKLRQGPYLSSSVDWKTDCFFCTSLLPALISLRPEPIATVWILWLALAYNAKLSTFRQIGAYSFGLSLLIATSPISGILAFMSLISFDSMSLRLKELARLYSRITGLTFIFFWLWLEIFFPFPPNDWFRGILHHYHLISKPADFGEILHYYITAPNRFLFGIPIVGAFIKLFFFGGIAPKQTKILLGVTTALVVIFAVARPERSYNLIPFIPIFFLIMTQTNLRTDGRNRWLLRISTFIAIAMNIGFAAYAVRTLSSSTIDLPEARSLLRKQLLSNDSMVISASLFPLIGDLGKIESVLPTLNKKSCASLIIAQSGTGKSQPPQIPNTYMSQNYFSAPIKLFGYLLARTPAGYNFAVYRPIQPCP